MVTSAIIWHNTIKTTRSNKSLSPNLEYTILKLISVWSYIIHIFNIYHMVLMLWCKIMVWFYLKNYATLRWRSRRST